MVDSDICLSVIIPYYQKWPRTRFLIESLNRQDFDGNYEVLIVDDGSTPSLRSQLKDVKVVFPIHIIEQSNGGRSNARNTGAEYAKGDIVIFVDDDMILFPDFLKRHYEKNISTDRPVFVHGDMYDLVELTPYQDPEKGIYYDFIETATKTGLRKVSGISFKNVFNDWDTFVTRKKRTSRLEKLIQAVISDSDLSAMHWIGCVGGNVSMKREIFKQAGGFDSRFIYWGGEDFELGYRLRLNGVEVEQIDPCCYHMTHAHAAYYEKRKISEDYFYQKYNDENIRNLYAFLEKRMDQKEIISRIGG